MPSPHSTELLEDSRVFRKFPYIGVIGQTIGHMIKLILQPPFPPVSIPMYFISSVLVQTGNTWKYLLSGVDIDLGAGVWEGIQEGGWWRKVGLSVLLFDTETLG